MNVTTIPDWIDILFLIGFGALLLFAVSRCQFGWLLQEGRSNRLLVCSIVQFLLWQIGIPLPGMELHVLGVTVMTLMFGWEFALLGGAITLGLHVLLHSVPYLLWGTKALVLLVTPIATSYVFARLIQRYLPLHFFVYVYICAFAGGALSMLVHALMARPFFRPVVEFEGISPLLPWVLMMFAEGFFSGGLLTLMVVYRPTWVVSFNDELYSIAPPQAGSGKQTSGR